MEQTPKKNIHQGHRQRLRKQVIYSSDLSALPEHNVLETLLSFSIARKDVNPLAHELLDAFGSLSNVLSAPKEKLLQINGLGEVAVDHIKFCIMLPEYMKLSKKTKGEKITTSADAVVYLRSKIEVTDEEKFYFALLDSNGKVIMFKSMSGTTDKIYIDMRSFVSQITVVPASAIVICHTHPHGDPRPSRQDIDFTLKLENLLKTIGILLCDHIILTPDDYYSFYRNGRVRRDIGLFSIDLGGLNQNSDAATYLDEK